MKRILSSVVLSVMVLAILPAPPSSAASLYTDIQDNLFSPDHSDAPYAGITGQWHNSGTHNHSAAADAPFAFFNTGTIAAGADGFADVDFAGTFLYHCNFHASMHGTVRVPVDTLSNPVIAGTPLVILVGATALPTGYKFELQRRKTGGPWKTIYTGRQFGPVITFAGTSGQIIDIDLHSRVVKKSTGAVSKWSPIFVEQVDGT